MKVFLLMTGIFILCYVIFVLKYLYVWDLTQKPDILPLSWKIGDCSETSVNDTDMKIQKWATYYHRIIESKRPVLYQTDGNITSDCPETFSMEMKKNIQRVLRYHVMHNAPCIDNHRQVRVTSQVHPETSQYLSSARIPVIVTAVSSNHFLEIQALLKNIHMNLVPHYTNLKVIVYDIGMDSTQLHLMRKYCKCEVRKFPFNEFPEHMRIVGAYAWKPIVVWEVLQEFDFVMWLDTSIRVRNSKKNWDNLFNQALSVGIMLQENARWKVKSQTKPDTFRILGEPECLYDYTELESGWILISRNWFTMHVIMRAWMGCALTKHCMTHPFPSYLRSCSKDLWKFLMNTRCHRFDQSVLNIILIRIFNNYRKIIEFDITNVGAVERNDIARYFPSN